MRTVGAYEAKTHLSQLLEEVAKGETITITKHGVPVATLAPPQLQTVRRKSAAEVIEEWREFREQVKPLDGMTVRELIDEGRRF